VIAVVVCVALAWAPEGAPTATPPPQATEDATASDASTTPAETTPPAEATRPADTADVGVVESPQSDPLVFPDPRKFSRGFFLEASTGPAITIGATQRVLSTGFSFSARAGYEIRRWIALQGHATGVLRRYDDGVLRRELLGDGIYTGEARLGVPFRRFMIAAHGGGGAHQVSNNLLQVADIAADNRRWSFAWDAGLSFDVHSLSRHFSGGLVTTFVGTPSLSGSGVLLVQLYMRYTHGRARVDERGATAERRRPARTKAQASARSEP
jgi:hypothetical protein